MKTFYFEKKFCSFLGEGVTGVKNVMSKTVFGAFGGLNLRGTRHDGVYACRSRRDASLGTTHNAPASVGVGRFWGKRVS